MTRKLLITAPARRCLLLCSLLAGLLIAPTGCTWFQTQRFAPKVSTADRAFEQRQYEQAAAYYESLLDQYPEETDGYQHILFQLGLSHYLVGSLDEANVVFRRYLQSYPEGEYAQLALRYREKIALQQSPDRVREELLGRARSDEAQLRRLLQEHPNDSSLLVALGNLLYDTGRYEEAVDLYHRALRIGAAHQERQLISERMMLDEDGRPVPVTPEMLRRIERERRPLVIYNTRDYRSRERTGSNGGGGSFAFYNVTGMVRNQSSRILHNVMLELTFFNNVNQIEDVTHVYIGTLAPGDIRAFRAAAGNFDTVDNIDDYAIIAHWE